MLQAFLLDLRQLDTSRRALRSFGVLVGGIITLIAAWVVWRSGSFALIQGGRLRPVAALGLTGLVVLALGGLRPKALRPLHFVWMAVALAVGALMTRLVLAIVFTLLIVPLGLVMKLLERDPLRRRMDPSQKSYWISRDDMDRSAERLEKYY